MPITATAASPRELIPEDTHIARCYSVVDIGTHQLNPKYPPRRDVIFSWELPLLLRDFKRDGITETLPVTKSSFGMSTSLGSKATRGMLEAWRGQRFTIEEMHTFDFASVIGAPCLLQIIHVDGTQGQTYDNIGSVTKLPRGLLCPPQVNPSIYFSFEDIRGDGLPDISHLPEWLQKKVQASEEWQTLSAQHSAPPPFPPASDYHTPPPMAPPPGIDSVTGEVDDSEDSLPF